MESARIRHAGSPNRIIGIATWLEECMESYIVGRNHRYGVIQNNIFSTLFMRLQYFSPLADINMTSSHPYDDFHPVPGEPT